ncbi:nucleotide-diphospho-sugar transferase [Mycena sp. CBHHK59/15]|nr:nucleotide-diphospho-sugar transferase [Mycena sp. CBHHK59/15]
MGHLGNSQGFPRRPYNPLDDYQNIQRGRKSPSRHAVVSSLYSDGFAIAVAVVGHSTRRANVTARLMLPYLEGQVSETALCITRVLGWETYADQYTKLNIWALDKQDIDSAVYLDADTLVRRNFDELFDSPFGFAAVPDVYGAGDPRGFSLTLNAGVLAFHPSSLILADMRRKLEVAQYPLKQAEQAFLNLYFGGTSLRLPYVYNANLAIKARSPALWARLEDEMRIVHYTGVKPFIHEGDRGGGDGAGCAAGGGFYAEEVAWWRREYRSMMREKGDGVKACYQASRTS